MDSNGFMHLDATLYLQVELHNYTLLQFLGEAVPALIFNFNFNNRPVCPM